MNLVYQLLKLLPCQGPVTTCPHSAVVNSIVLISWGVCLGQAFGQPSLDANHRIMVNLVGEEDDVVRDVMLMRDITDNRRWYYVPNQIALIEREEHGRAVPELSILKFDAGESTSQHGAMLQAIVRLEFTLAEEEELLTALRARDIEVRAVESVRATSVESEFDIPGPSSRPGLGKYGLFAPGTAKRISLCERLAGHEASLVESAVRSPIGLPVSISYSFGARLPPRPFRVRVSLRRFRQLRYGDSEVKAICDLLAMNAIAHIPDELIRHSAEILDEHSALSFSAPGISIARFTSLPLRDYFLASIRIASHKVARETEGEPVIGPDDVLDIDYAGTVTIPVDASIRGAIGLAQYDNDIVESVVTSVPAGADSTNLVLPVIQPFLGIQLVTVEGYLADSETGSMGSRRVARWEASSGWTESGNRPKRFLRLPMPPGEGRPNLDRLEVRTIVNVEIRGQTVQIRRTMPAASGNVRTSLSPDDFIIVEVDAEELPWVQGEDAEAGSFRMVNGMILAKYDNDTVDMAVIDLRPRVLSLTSLTAPSPVYVLFQRSPTTGSTLRSISYELHSRISSATGQQVGRCDGLLRLSDPFLFLVASDFSYEPQ